MPTQQMSRVKRQGRNNAIYRNARGGTRSVVAMAVQPRPSPPVLSAPAGSITGGTLNAGTYGYRISATVGGVEGLACAEQTGVVASGSTGSVALTWSAVAGASAYQVYGRTPGGELLLVSQAGTTYTDTNAATPAGALPGLANAKATLSMRATNVTPKSGFTNVTQAVAMRGATVRYFHRYGSPAGYPQPARS